MSNSVVDQVPFSDDHPPPHKRIRLDSVEKTESPVPSPSSTPSLDAAPSNNPSLKNDRKEEIEFDPVQAILEAGKKCHEEEQERIRKHDEVTKGKNNNNQDDSAEDDVVSLDESDSAGESEEEKNGEATVAPKKREKSKSKKGKKKKSHMRRNIKDILKPEQLDDLTIAARKEEEERIRRTQIKQQQLRLLQLQQQQSQLLRESLNTPVNDTYPPNSQFTARFADNLMRRLIQKKHITVSLNQSGGIPDQSVKQSAEEDDCILLSSDDESEKFKSKLNLPSHLEQQLNPTAIGDSRERRKFLATNEVIALSSGEEDNLVDNHATSLKHSHLYDSASRIVGDGASVGGVESDDDCVIISPEPEGEEETDDKDECSQDLLNVPDNLGRVLVNVGHPEEDKDIFLPPQIAKIVKPHQIGGIRFLYDNVVESRERYIDTSGFGCILAHAMGLGKTLQTVSFCDVLLRTVGKTVLIIVPINTIQNWLNEFNRYLPSKNGEDSTTEYNSPQRRRCAKSKFAARKEELERFLQNGAVNQSPAEMVPDGTGDLPCKSESDSAPVNPSCSKVENPGEASGTSSPATCSSTPETPTSSSSANIQYRNFDVFLLNETVKSLQAREKTIRTWSKDGGVLLIGYEMYRMLALKKLKKSTRKAMTQVHEERFAEAESLNNIYECLVDPGPDCVICDEGHRIKNSGAGISQALKAIKTKRRVVLTGYPLQNNLMEYWCMVDFVRPNYLGTKAEFSNMFERPIQNGQCADSTYEDKKLMKYRSHVLHSLLEGFVQRRSHVVLRNALPQKEEWVFLVRLTAVQLRIYREFIRYLRDDLESDNASANPIKAFAVCCKIWNHPDVLWNVVKKNLDLEMDLDIDEVKPVARPNKPKRGTGRPRGRPPLNGISLAAQMGSLDPFEDGMFPHEDTPTSTKTEGTGGISLEWAKPLFENYAPEVMENGVKFELLFELIQETVACQDKLLVFSQSLLTLDLIEVFLKKRLDWKKYHDYVRLDGSTAGLEREKLINEFNRSTIQKVFLISTRAGSLGINLVGANRVCIFDASWNPCHDSQAVCRVYRYGQTKPCHIYRFVADCTLEKRIYDRQVNKKGMADRIVDEMNPNTPFKSKDVSSFLVLQHDLLEKLPYIKCDVTLEKFGDAVMKNLLQRIGQKITQEPFEHESLLIDQKHQRLSKSEKRLALKNYEKEKQTVANAYVPYSRPSYAQYYSSIGTMGSSSSYSSYSASASASASRYTEQHQRSYSTVEKCLTSGTATGVRSLSGFGGSMGSCSFDRFELHINALKTRGISVFPVELHQDTFLNDPSGSSNIYVRAGERVYILVSQKGTYLRIQGKLLRVPFVGTDMTQDQAERFVMSLLQLPNDPGGQEGSELYPAEQQLPPSTNMFSMKNASHLQITNSRNTTGGDVMVSMESNWSNGGHNVSSTSSANSSKQQQQRSNLMSGLPMHLSSLVNDTYTALQQHVVNIGKTSGTSSQSDLQSLSKLAETFCHRTSPYHPSSSETGDNGKQQWCPSPSSSSLKYDSVVSPPVDLEVIKLNRSHSSSNSNSSSSNSRTNSPYASRQSWNEAPTTTTAPGNSSWPNTKDPSFYTDFTITPLSRNNPATAVASPSKHSSQQQPSSANNYWGNGNSSSSNGATNSSNSSDFYNSLMAARDASQPQHPFQESSSFQGFGSTNTFGHTLSSPLELTNKSPNLGVDLSPAGHSSGSIRDSPNTSIAVNEEQTLQDAISSLTASSYF